jgi:hypothetical protein
MKGSKAAQCLLLDPRQPEPEFLEHFPPPEPRNQYPDDA